MARRTTITSKGVVTRKGDQGGLGIDADADNTGFSPYQKPVNTAADATTLTAADAGAHVLSGETPVATLPTAASVPGTIWTFRRGSSAANITGSQEVTDTQVFSDGTNNGSRITLGGVTGDSVALMSDGTNFLVIGSSGSVVLNFP